MAPVWTLIGTGAVTLLALTVSGAGYRSMLRTGNAAIGYIAVAFLVLGLKNAVKLAFLLGTGSVPAAWEAIFIVCDVTMVGLIAWPLVRRRA